MNDVNPKKECCLIIVTWVSLIFTFVGLFLWKIRGCLLFLIIAFACLFIFLVIAVVNGAVALVNLITEIGSKWQCNRIVFIIITALLCLVVPIVVKKFHLWNLIDAVIGFIGLFFCLIDIVKNLSNKDKLNFNGMISVAGWFLSSAACIMLYIQ